MTGLLLIDKPQGMTSFSVCSRVRRISGAKKAGHTGTLDPLATGVLPVALGGATRFCELLPSHDKAYTACVRLGIVTDTLDVTGEVLERREVSATKEDFEAALKLFVGEIEQTPPMYSAVLQNGVRLYKLARQGIQVDRPTRRVRIGAAGLVSCDERAGEYTIDIECSAGTYIRSLIADIGEKLGCGAVMTALRRTAANGFSIDDCLSLEQLEQLAGRGELSKAIVCVETALNSYGEVHVTQPQAVRFANGGALSLERLRCAPPARGELLRVFSAQDGFIGMGEAADGELRVKRLLVR